jgi:hypothetical protein
MANSKITDLPASSSIALTDLLEVATDPAGTPDSESATLQQVRDLVLDLGGSSYTPSWTSSGTAPALGNGSITGSYVRIGDLGWFSIQFIAGSTTTFGTGAYSFSLPAGWTGVNRRQPVSLMVFDSSASQRWGGSAIVNNSTTVGNGAFDTEDNMGQTVPFTFANSDQILIAGMVELVPLA